MATLSARNGSACPTRINRSSNRKTCKETFHIISVDVTRSFDHRSQDERIQLANGRSALIAQITPELVQGFSPAISFLAPNMQTVCYCAFPLGRLLRHERMVTLARHRVTAKREPEIPLSKTLVMTRKHIVHLRPSISDIAPHKALVHWSYSLLYNRVRGSLT